MRDCKCKRGQIVGYRCVAMSEDTHATVDALLAEGYEPGHMVATDSRAIQSFVKYAPEEPPAGRSVDAELIEGYLASWDKIGRVAADDGDRYLANVADWIYDVLEAILKGEECDDE